MPLLKSVLSRIRKLRISRLSLRTKVVIGISLPLIVFLFINSYYQYIGAQHLYVKELELISSQIGEMMRSSLHQSMLTNDKVLLERTVADISRMAFIRDVQIVNLQGQVKVSSTPTEIGRVHTLAESGCIICHQKSVDQQLTSARLKAGDNLFRISSPIANEPVCHSCHDPAASHLGVLLVDVSTLDFNIHLLSDLRLNLIYSLLGVAGIVLITYWMIHRQVVRRVEDLMRPISVFTDGDYSARQPQAVGIEDELTDLAKSFNHMADELDRHRLEQEKVILVRTQAIVQERERIARELHDGLGQLIGYVNTKAYTVRLLMKKNKNGDAERELTKLEEAAQGLFLDMREAVLSLRMAVREDDLPNALKYCVDQFSRLSNLPVELSIATPAENWPLENEVQLHLLRIVQEALSNARKYSHATRIQVSLSKNDVTLHLMISDNGKGFNQQQQTMDTRPHFGLSTMRERAEAIGGQFTIESQPGIGTRIHVSVPDKGPVENARSGS